MGTKHMPFGVEYERKVHLFYDQKGVTIKHSNRLFANTACKMNSDVPQSHITTDIGKVTCKICLQKKQSATQFERILRNNSNMQYGKFGYPQSMVTPELYSKQGWRMRYRLNWRRKLILQVEEIVFIDSDLNDPHDMGRNIACWRDATLADLPYPGLGVV